jgi:hypothetical protein
MKYGGRRTKHGGIFSKLSFCLFIVILASFVLPPSAFGLRAPNVHAQTRTLSDSLPTTNVNSTETKGKGAFKLIVCDGPAALNDPSTHSKESGWKKDPNFVPCDFNGVMLQIQHLINIMMVLGVITTITSMSYMGYLFISGTESNRKKAKEIFPKLFWGFIIMLTAWFIVFQILAWLTGNSGFTSLLGKP